MARWSSGVGAAGDGLWLLGRTRDELGGSEWAHVAHGHLGGRPPEVDLAAEAALARLLASAAREGVVSRAHDLSEGGLAQALVEACLLSGAGARVTLPGDPFVALFAESSARVLVAVPVAAQPRFLELCGDVPHTRLGVAGGDALGIDGLPRLPLDELRTAWESTLPALFG